MPEMPQDLLSDTMKQFFPAAPNRDDATPDPVSTALQDILAPSTTMTDPGPAASENKQLRDASSIPAITESPDAPSFTDQLGLFLQNHKNADEDAPLPKTWQEAVRSAADKNIAVRHYDGIAARVDKKATQLAVQFAQAMGGIEAFKTPKDFMDVVNAYRYNLTIMQSPISPDEMPRVASQYVRNLSAQAKQRVNDRLINMINDGMDPSDPRVTKLQDHFARLQSWEARADEPTVQEAFLVSARRALDVQKRRQPESLGELQDAQNAIDWMWFPNPVPEDEMHRLVDDRLQRASWGNTGLAGHTNKLLSALRIAFDTDGDYDPGKAQLASLWQSSVQQARLGMFSDDEAFKQQGTLAATIVKTHPALIARLNSDLTERRARAELGGTAANRHGLRRWADKNAEKVFGTWIGSLLRGRTADELQREVTAFRSTDDTINEVLGAWVAGTQTLTVGLDAAQEAVRDFRINLLAKDRPGLQEHLEKLGDPVTNSPWGDVARDGDLAELREQLQAGNVDPVLVQRLMSSNDRAGILETGPLMMMIDHTLPTVVNQLGPLAKEDPRFITAELLGTVMREQWDDVVAKTLDSGALLDPAAVEQVNIRAAKAMKEQSFFDALPEVYFALVGNLSAMARDGVDMVVTDNKRLASEALLGYAMGVGTKGVAGAITKSDVAQAAVDGIQNMRTRDAMANLVYWSPQAAEKARDSLTEIIDTGVNTGRMRKAVRKARALADSVVEDHKLDWHGLDETTRQAKIDRLTVDVYDFRSTMGKLNGETLNKVFDDMEVHHAVEAATRSSKVMKPIRTITRAITEKLGRNRRHLYGAVADEGENLARRLDNLIDSGMDPETLATALDDIPLSLHGLSGDSVLERWARGSGITKRLNKLWDGKFSRVQAQAGSMIRDIVEFGGKWLPEARNWRRLQAAAREAQLRTLAYLRNKAQIDIEDFSNASGMLPETATDLRATFQRIVRDRTAKVERYHNLANELDSLHLDDAQRLSDVEDVIEQLDLDDIDVLGTQMYSRRDELFENLRDGTDLDEFQAEWKAAAENPELPESQAFTAKMRRKFAQRHLDQPGLIDDVPIDESGAMFLPGRGQQVDTIPVGKKIKELREWAERTGAAKEGGLVTRVFELTDGNIHRITKAARDSEMGVRVSMTAHHNKLKSFERRYKNLPDSQKAEFDRALKEANNGNSKSLREYLAKDKEMRVHMGAGTIDENVERLLLDSDDFRLALLTEANRAGLRGKNGELVVPDEDLERLRGPYFPHKYETHEINNLLRTHADKVLPEKGPKGGATGGSPGQDLSEFMSQRHLTRHRLMVDRGRAGKIQKEFDTAEEAAKYAQEKFGVGEFKADGKTQFGAGDLGEQVRILAPIGKLEDFLELLPAGPTLFDRLSTMLRDTALARYLNVFDRPGWAMTDEAFTAWKNAPGNQRLVKDFIKIEKGSGFGNLEGKWVPRRMLAETRHFFESFDVMKDMAEIAREATFGGTLSGTMLGKAVGIASKPFDWAKKLLASNAIARNPVTMATNVLMDREVFARMAFGSDYLYSAGGREARDFAWRALLGDKKFFGSRVAQAQIDRIGRKAGEFPAGLAADEQAILDMAIEHGVLDESMIGASGIDEVHQRFMVESVYGEADLPPGLPKSGREALEMVADAGKPSQQELTLMTKIAKVEEQLADELSVLEAGGQGLLDSLVNKKLVLQQALEDISRKSGMRRVWQGAESLAYRLLGNPRGLAGSVKSTSREIYARLSNIHRLGGFRYLIKKGWSPEEAVEQINKFMQNYQAVPKPVRALSRTPLGSAITSFPYEMMRITRNWIKEKPFAYMGLVGAAPAVNTATLAASGADPMTVMETLETQSGGLPGFMALTNGLVLPMPGSPGEFSFASLPGINPYSMFRTPFGAMGGIVHPEDFPDSTMGDLGRLGFNAGSQFFLGNPMASAAYTMLSGRDPIRRRPIAGGPLERAGEALEQLGRLVVPNHTPFIGGASQQLTEYIEQPPTVRSERSVTTLEGILQTTTGLRVRGGLLDHAAEAAGLGDALDTVVQGVARAVTTAPSKAIKFRPDPNAFSETDFISVLLWDSRRIDPGDRGTIDAPIDKAYNDLRLGVTIRREGTAKENDAQIKYGDQLIKDALKQFADDRRASARLLGEIRETELRPDALGNPDRKLVNAVVRALRSSSTTRAFAGISPVRQAFVLSKLAESPYTTEDTLGEFAGLTLISPDLRVEQGGDPGNLQSAVDLLNAALEKETISDASKAVIQRARDNFALRIPRAAANALLRDLTDQSRFEAIKVIRGE